MENRIRLYYEKYDIGKKNYDNLIGVTGDAQKQTATVKSEYLSLDSTDFDVYSFPINIEVN